MANLKSKEKAPEPKEEAKVRIASHEMFMYHKTEEAKIFKQGEVIPDGWTDAPGGK